MSMSKINDIRFDYDLGWDRIFVGFDPSLNRFACAVVGRKEGRVRPISCFWGPVSGCTRGEKMFNLSFMVHYVICRLLKDYFAYYLDEIPVSWGIESNFMNQDSDSFRTIVMADAVIRMQIEPGHGVLQDINNSTWKSHLLGKPSSEGKKSWDKSDISRLLGAKYGVSIPPLSLGVYQRGPRKGEEKCEHNDAWDALGVALYMAEKY